MYRLEISSYIGLVKVESTDFQFLADVQAAVESVRVKHDAKFEVPLTRSNVVAMADTLFDKELAKMKTNPPVKRGRGRPAGSKNKK
jgi:hypothetical protein